MIGKTISHYKIIEKIGEGGMGIVYKALDLKLDRFVALKFLPAHMGKDETQKQRFINEAKAVSAFDHPNICTIFEINETEDVSSDSSSGRIFICMAYYDGQTLEEKITADKPMPIDEAIGIIIQIARGLQRAHEKDIVHRDIKPANIIIPNEAEVKIVDFGLAKLKGQPKLTKQESTLGTILYMSPEQAEGAEMDARTDIWSLGVIFYEMLTGKSPFSADYEQAVIYNVINANPEPVTKLNNEVPTELEQVIQKCLEKDRDNRFQTVKEFISELDQVINQYKYLISLRSGDYHPAENIEEHKKVKPVLQITAVLIAICLIVFAIIFWPQSSYTAYEEAYFSKHFEESRDASKDERTPDNIKANRYYLLSTAASNQNTLPSDVKQEYRDLLLQNPDSPQANYYLGLVYFLSAEKRSERDSVWILYDRAESLGLSSIYLKIDLLTFYMDWGNNQQALEMANLIKEKYPDNPEAMYEIGYLYYISSDTSLSRKYLQHSLFLYSDHISPIIDLHRLALKKDDLTTAKKYLDRALAINNEYIRVVRYKTSLLVREGKLEEAEEYLKNIINGFGKNDVRFYKYLARLYQKQDLFEPCNKLITLASEKFPDDAYFPGLKRSLAKRAEWLQLEEQYKSDKKMVQWSENFEAAMAKAVREKKPLFIEFYSTNEFWSRDLEKDIYPDPQIQKLLKSYITLRVNGELEINLAKKYGADYYPALVVLNENGDQLTAIRYFFPGPSTDIVISDLEKGLVLHKKYVEGKTIRNQHITEVSNIHDALLLSKTKNLPVMAVILSKESEWSQKLVNETFTSPLLQSELRNVIRVNIDPTVNKSLVKKWNINYFPSIIFLDENGEKMHLVQGYQPPKLLAALIADLNNAMALQQDFKNRISWFYNLEEAKFFASLQKKEIFTFANADWCPFCRWMIKYTFKNPLVIKTLNEKFVPLELHDVRDTESLKSIGISGFPTFLVLDSEQTEILRLTGAQTVSKLLAALDLEERKPIYSILGREKYQEFYKYALLAEEFLYYDFFLSAIHASQKQIAIYPEYWQSYLNIAKAYQELGNPDKILSYYFSALDNGAEINMSITENVLSTYLQQNDPQGFEKWIQNTLQSRTGNHGEAAILYRIYSEYYEILQDRNSAIAMADKSITLNPSSPEGFIKLGRLYYLENRIDKAKSYLSKADQIDKNDARTSFYLGLIAEQVGDVIEKERYFEQARKKNDRSVHEVGWRTRYVSRPGYYLFDGYLDLIEQGYRDQLKLKNEVNTKNSFAYFLALENRKLDEALRLIDDALEKMPNDMDLLDTKAVILYQLGQYKKSHEILLQYEHTIEKKDLEQDLIYSSYLGKIKWAVGDTVSAKNYFKYVLKKTDPNAMDKRAQTQVKKIMAEHNL